MSTRSTSLKACERCSLANGGRQESKTNTPTKPTTSLWLWMVSVVTDSPSRPVGSGSGAEGSPLVGIPGPRTSWPWQKAVLHSGGSAARELVGPAWLPVMTSWLFGVWPSSAPEQDRAAARGLAAVPLEGLEQGASQSSLTTPGMEKWAGGRGGRVGWPRPPEAADPSLGRPGQAASHLNPEGQIGVSWERDRESPPGRGHRQPQ